VGTGTRVVAFPPAVLNGLLPLTTLKNSPVLGYKEFGVFCRQIEHITRAMSLETDPVDYLRMFLRKPDPHCSRETATGVPRSPSSCGLSGDVPPAVEIQRRLG